jgi:hypothetical protein
MGGRSHGCVLDGECCGNFCPQICEDLGDPYSGIPCAHCYCSDGFTGDRCRDPPEFNSQVDSVQVSGAVQPFLNGLYRRNHDLSCHGAPTYELWCPPPNCTPAMGFILFKDEVGDWSVSRLPMNTAENVAFQFDGTCLFRSRESGHENTNIFLSSSYFLPLSRVGGRLQGFPDFSNQHVPDSSGGMCPGQNMSSPCGSACENQWFEGDPLLGLASWVPNPNVTVSCLVRGSCSSAMQRACNTSKAQGKDTCLVCCGKHSTELQRQGCAQANFESFCS